MNDQLLAWGIVVVLVLAASVIGAVLVRRARASRVVDRDERLRLAKRAARQLAKTSGKTRKGSMRGTGTAADSDNTSAAAYWGGADGVHGP